MPKAVSAVSQRCDVNINQRKEASWSRSKYSIQSGKNCGASSRLTMSASSFACESGSRAWGFASQDSDYDVRFMYVHTRDWYLSIEDRRDVIEEPISEGLDLSGWERRKTLRLLRKSNPPLLEWLKSPVVYAWDEQFVSDFKQGLYLPMPSDGGLRRIADGITADPSDRATVYEWAKRIGLSERSLRRLVIKETGMSFGRWRQQLHIIMALQWLSQGASVQSVATDLGYENASSFVVMFRKALGASPARYMTQRLEGAPPTASKA
jgi:AraC-like DNA-binding protein